MTEIIDYVLTIDLGICNFSYCLMQLPSEKIIRWDVTSIGNMKDSHEEICSKLAKKLTSLGLNKLSDEGEKVEKVEGEVEGEEKEKKEIRNLAVICELQPTKNIKTLVMSGQVIMYYTLEKLKNLHLGDPNYLNISKVTTYHASNKLKYYKFKEGDEPIALDHLKNGHYKNKKLSICHCKRILIQRSETVWLDFFNSNTKKDDLGDTYLSNLSYIKNNTNRVLN